MIKHGEYSNEDQIKMIFNPDVKSRLNKGEVQTIEKAFSEMQRQHQETKARAEEKLGERKKFSP